MEDKNFSDTLKKIFIPLLILFGTFGNLISIKIFSKDSMKSMKLIYFLNKHIKNNFNIIKKNTQHYDI